MGTSCLCLELSHVLPSPLLDPLNREDRAAASWAGEHACLETERAGVGQPQHHFEPTKQANHGPREQVSVLTGSPAVR